MGRRRGGARVLGGSQPLAVHPKEVNTEKSYRQRLRPTERKLSPDLVDLSEFEIKRAISTVMREYEDQRSTVEETLEILRMLGLAEPTHVWVKAQSGEHSRIQIPLKEWRAIVARKEAARIREKRRNEQFKGLHLEEDESKKLAEEREEDKRILHESVHEAIKALRAGKLDEFLEDK